MQSAGNSGSMQVARVSFGPRGDRGTHLTAATFLPISQFGLLTGSLRAPAWMELVRFIGASELLGAIGLVLAAVTRSKPVLTALAAAGLVIVMVLAAGFHVSRGELQMLPPSLVLGAFAAFVAWGRFKKAPIAPRRI
jgi:DoxX-like family